MRPLGVTSEILVQKDGKNQFSLVVHELELLQKWSPRLASCYTFQVVPHCSGIHHCGTLAHAFWRTDLHLFIRLQLTQVRHSPLSAPQKLDLIGSELSKYCLISSCLKLSAKPHLWWYRDLIAILFCWREKQHKATIIVNLEVDHCCPLLAPHCFGSPCFVKDSPCVWLTILERWWGT